MKSIVESISKAITNSELEKVGNCQKIAVSGCLELLANGVDEQELEKTF